MPHRGSEALARRAGVTSLELGAHLYERRDAEAVAHLFRVASSLDSLVLGEPQILGQTKQAHETAGRGGSAGALLNACFQRAFRVAKRVRRETAIARNPVSISSVAIELARQVFGGFDRRQVLVVGAGKMSELAARTLRAHGATLTVINRTRARAEELSARFGAGVRDWSELPAALTEADIVIASTGAQRPVLTLETLKQVQRARRGRPLFLLDIAVPRDVEPEAGKLDGIYLADIDDLQKVAAEHRDARKDEAADAEAIVDQELGRFLKAWRGRQLAPTVTALRAHVLGVAQAEATRVAAGLSGSASARSGRSPISPIRSPRSYSMRRRWRCATTTPTTASRWWWRCSGCSRWRWRRPPPPRPRPTRTTARAPGRRCLGQESGRSMSAASSLGALIIGTRGSALARWQAGEIARLLRRGTAGPGGRERIIVTAGDRAQTGPPVITGRKRRLGRGDRGGALRARDRRGGPQPERRAGRTGGPGWRSSPCRRAPIRATRSSAGRRRPRRAPPGSRVGTSSLRRVCQLRAVAPT